MKCYNCGQLVEDDAAYCSRCGVSFDTDTKMTDDSDSAQEPFIRKTRWIVAIFVIFIAAGIIFGVYLKGQYESGTVQYVDNHVIGVEEVDIQTVEAINTMLLGMSKNRRFFDQQLIKKINSMLVGEMNRRYLEYVDNGLTSKSLNTYLKGIARINLKRSRQSSADIQDNVRLVEVNRKYYLNAQQSYDKKEYHRAYLFSNQIQKVKGDTTYKLGNQLNEKCRTDEVFNYYLNEAKRMDDQNKRKNAIILLRNAKVIFTDSDMQISQLDALAEVYSMQKWQTAFGDLLTTTAAVQVHRKMKMSECDSFALLDLQKDGIPELILRFKEGNQAGRAFNGRQFVFIFSGMTREARLLYDGTRKNNVYLSKFEDKLEEARFFIVNTKNIQLKILRKS